MSKQNRLAIAIGGVLIILLTGLIVAATKGGTGPTTVDSPAEESALMRSDAHVLGEEGASGVTLVEFLDFECEACGAAYPIVERLRAKYAGRVTFIARYFPLPGHFNAERAARAVEAAARQGQFEAMYSKMYQTQSSWGEAKTPHDDLFRSFAAEIGLDLETFDADYASAEVKARVQRDVDDGIELGVSATPTFFVDGEPFEPRTVGDFTRMLDLALAQ